MCIRDRVSSDGVITSEESKTAETYSEVVEGMMFDRGYITPYMVTAVSYTHLFRIIRGPSSAPG